LLNVINSKKYFHKIIGKLLSVLFKNSIGIGIGNTFCGSIVIGIDSSFHKYC